MCVCVCVWCGVYDAVLALLYKHYRTYVCDVFIPAAEHLDSYDADDYSAYKYYICFHYICIEHVCVRVSMCIRNIYIYNIIFIKGN